MSTMAIICPVCDSRSFNDLYAQLVRCQECGFVTAANQEDNSPIPSLYKEDYFNGDEYADYFGDKKIIQKNLNKWLKVVRQHVPGGSLVEVGSAYGFFLELAQKKFDVVGYEVDTEVVKAARQIVKGDVRNQDFLSDDSISNESVDAVVMWDVIEHLAEPDHFIERSAQILKLGGHIFLTTGDIDSWLPRRQGPRWRLIHPPTHLQYFSVETLQRLLKRYGFEIVRVSHPGYWRSVEQILHGLFVFNKTTHPPLPYRILKRILPRKLGIYLNTYDIMLVAAKKIALDSQSTGSSPDQSGAVRC